jgi:hypothetical protein
MRDSVTLGGGEKAATSKKNPQIAQVDSVKSTKNNEGRRNR